MSTSFQIAARRRLPGFSKIVTRTIASQRSRSSAPQAIVQATNVIVQAKRTPTNYVRPQEEPRIARRLATSRQVVASDEAAEQDIHVDMLALQTLASQSPTPLRLADMYKYACTGDVQQRLRNAQFLHKELPIRIAQRAMDLLTLPHGLNETSHVRQVAHVYLRYIEMFQQMSPPVNQDEEDNFTVMLQSLVLDRASIPSAIAQGIADWEKQHDPSSVNPSLLHEMEAALYRFFTARVGLRFLTEHHILSSPIRRHTSELLRHHSHLLRGDYLGCIQTNCDPSAEIKKVAAEVKRQTLECYGRCPNIEVVDRSLDEAGEFTYVPHHLHYMVAELLKNSCRATVMNHIHETELPPVLAVVVKGAEDVSIKVADRGGGAPRSTMDKIWKFAHSTANDEEIHTDFGKDEFSGGRIRGFGLPLARIYARYFGGELTLRSMEGYGVDAYLYLPRLGHSCEKLPVSVTASPGEQDSIPKSTNLQSMAPIVSRGACEPLNERRVFDMLQRKAL